MDSLTLALDGDGYYRAETFKGAIEDDPAGEYYNVGFGACGCLYDGVVEGFETFADAYKYVTDVAYEEYGIEYPESA